MTYKRLGMSDKKVDGKNVELKRSRKRIESRITIVIGITYARNDHR